MKKWKLWYEICESREKAERVAAAENMTGSAYKRKRYPAFITPWNEPKHPGYFLVWSRRIGGIC